MLVMMPKDLRIWSFFNKNWAHVTIKAGREQVKVGPTSVKWLPWKAPSLPSPAPKTAVIQPLSLYQPLHDRRQVLSHKACSKRPEFPCWAIYPMVREGQKHACLSHLAWKLFSVIFPDQLAGFWHESTWSREQTTVSLTIHTPPPPAVYTGLHFHS